VILLGCSEIQNLNIIISHLLIFLFFLNH
jgi:hypothetical protein